jgi:hypothetical protein
LDSITAAENREFFRSRLTGVIIEDPAIPANPLGSILVPRRYTAPCDCTRDLWQSEAAMTITYANGTTVEGIALVCTDGLMRVALRGYADSVEFIAGEDGTWLSESGEPVHIAEGTPRLMTAESLDEFICPPHVLANFKPRADAVLR